MNSSDREIIFMYTYTKKQW